MSEHPGIVFRPGPTGRRAGLVSGPTCGKSCVRLSLPAPLDARYRAASQAHAGLVLVSAKTFPQDRSYPAALTGALSALLDQPGQIQPGHVLFLSRQ